MVLSDCSSAEFGVLLLPPAPAGKGEEGSRSRLAHATVGIMAIMWWETEK